MLVYIVNAAVAVFLMYLIGELTKVEGKEGFTFSVYPWITTFPETLTTALLAISGYTVAAFYNSVFSAIFDAAVAFGLVALTRGVVRFKLVDLALLAGVAGIAFVFTDLDGVIDLSDAVLLYCMLIVLTTYSIAKYGWGRFTRSDAFKAVAGVALLALVGYWYYQNVEAMIPFIGERFGGIISAVLTSIPDLIVAVVYGLEDSVSQAEIVGCIAHDFIENIPTAALVATLVAGRPLTDADPTSTAVVVAITVVPLILAASYRRITRFEGAMLLAAFALAILVGL